MRLVDGEHRPGESHVDDFGREEELRSAAPTSHRPPSTTTSQGNQFAELLAVGDRPPDDGGGRAASVRAGRPAGALRRRSWPCRSPPLIVLRALVPRVGLSPSSRLDANFR